MKLLLCFILLSALNASGSGFSQNTAFNFPAESQTVKEVIKNIENQSNFRFLYNDDFAGLNRVVSISPEDKNIDELLGELLLEANLTYRELENNLIVLTPSEYSVQQHEVTGKVVDKSGNSLPGVSIVLQGTTTGTVTNADGLYTLNVSPESTLIFTFVGMETQVIQVGGRTAINVVMADELIGIQEVIAVGYATQVAGEVTGSVSSVRSDQMKSMTAITAGETLRGSVSGVTITSSNTPGAGSTIRVRGLGTINDNEPLWVVDGVPGGTVHPNNIESITILKDAASQAIYGARASNGVILVTTKTGRTGQPVQIDASVRRGFKRNIREYDLMNTQEYGEMLWLQAANDGVDNFSHVQYGSGATPTIPKYIRPAGSMTADLSMYDNRFVQEDGDDTFIIMEANQVGTNWMDEITQDAAYQEYNVSMSGGSDNTTYAFQIGYMDEEGVVIHSGYDRYNLRSNITTNPTPWLQIGKRLGVTYQTTLGNLGDHGEASPISYTYRMQSIVPVYDIMGNHAGTRAEGTGNARNAVNLQWRSRHNNDKDLRSTGNVYADATIIKGLTFRSLVGFNYRSQNRLRYNYPERAFSERGYYSSAEQRSDFGFQWNWTNTLQYKAAFADVHNLTVMLGSEAIDNVSNNAGGSRTGYFSDNPLYMTLSTGEFNQTNFSGKSEWSLFSVFARTNYAYDNRYFLELVARRDASSRFGQESRYGIFPAMSAGWRITNEDFMRAADNWLEFMMLRVGYGVTGNDRVGNYNAFSTYASDMGNSFYPITGVNVGVGTPGFYANSIGNPLVAWETTATYNAGFRANFLQNWDVSFDVWRRNTKDMLFPQRIPDVRGQASAPSINVGEMMNNGLDFELGYTGAAMNNDLTYMVSVNLSRYKNEIVTLSTEADERLEGDQFRQFMYTMAEQGTAFPVFYGYQLDGIFQTDAEAAAHPPAFGDYNQAGKFIFRDVNNDGIINADDRTVIGDPHPDFTGGLNIDIGYKGFNLSTRIYGSYGNELVNYVHRWIDFGQFLGNRSKKRLYESWGSPYLSDNSNAALPKISASDAIDQYPSSYFVEDASYLRMQNLQLSYNVSNILKSRLREIVIYGHVTNVFTLTNYSGLDPEINRSGVNMGIDAGAWPTPRQFLFGINIGI